MADIPDVPWVPPNGCRLVARGTPYNPKSPSCTREVERVVYGKTFQTTGGPREVEWWSCREHIEEFKQAPQTSAVTPFGLDITEPVDVSDLDDHRKEPAEVVARRAVNDRRLMATPKLRAINMEICADRERWMNGEPTKSPVLVYHLRLKLAFAEYLEEES
ncbi:uncharacterized protein PG986_005104 [Apiospora aurea]|uniref:Uncharacterized protein n=1 Tax=Apiospora aurea TaxID=335848 RepID=A0ABR1QGL1_9PEZI